MLKKFTLIELIVVIAIIAILASIVIPNIRNVQGEATIAAIQSNAKNIQTAVDMYALDNNGKYPTNDQPTEFIPQPIDFNKLIPKYLRKLPEVEGIKYWVDFKGKVWIATIDSPININLEDGKLTWDIVEGAMYYNVYELEGYTMSGSPIKNYSIKLIDTTEVNETSNISEGKAYLVNAIDFKGFESSPVGFGYTGYVIPNTPRNPDNPNPTPEPEEPESPINEKPIAVITMTPENNLNQLTEITFSHNQSIDDGHIVEAEWQINENTVSNKAPNGKFSEGTYTVKLRVKDNQGEWSEWVSKTFVVEKVNVGLSFDGVDDIAIVSDIGEEFTNKFMANVRVKRLGDSEYRQRIITLGYVTNEEEIYDIPYGFSISLRSGGELHGDNKIEVFAHLGRYYQVLTSETEFGIGETHDIRIEYDGEEFKLYVDNVLENSKVVEGEDNLPDGLNGLYIGRRSDLVEEANIIIESLQLWNDAVPYSENPNSSHPNLIGYWKFDEGEGNIIHDKSSYGHHGTIEGATWVAID